MEVVISIPPLDNKEQVDALVEKLKESKLININISHYRLGVDATLLTLVGDDVKVSKEVMGQPDADELTLIGNAMSFIIGVTLADMFPEFREDMMSTIYS